MSAESESTELDREVEASMRMFEKSKVGPAPTISAIKPSRVMLVLDGSPQDATAIDAAVHLRQRFDTETLILDARDKAEDDDSDLAVNRTAEVTGSRPIKRKEGDSYDAILAALQDHAVDLLIVPCPFGRVFEQVGADSAGTVMDVLLSRCAIPILLIRRDDQRLGECAAHVSMIVGDQCDAENRAAAWAFGLAAESARVTLDLVIEKQQFDNIRAILEALHPDESLEPEQFSDALTKTHQMLHGAMAKTAAALGLSYHMRPQAGDVAPPNPLNESSKMLLVMPLEVDNRFEQGFVHNRIRRSPHPVLVVPAHVPGSSTR
jgi:hypothetical protein